MNPSSIAALCAVFAVAGVAAPASAATVQRSFYQNGGSACTGALPTYEGALRKRPKAIANEGATAAFITCSAVANDMNSKKPSSVFVYFTNRGASAASVSCTMVSGDEFYGATAATQSLEISTGGFSSMFFFPEGVEFDRASVNLSCRLPPGVELNVFGHNILEDIGA